MKRFSLILAIGLMLTGTDAFAFGLRGGGGLRGGASRGGGRSMSRPVSRPSTSHLGGSRPSFSRPSPSRPSVSRPTPSRPSMPSRPSISRPSTPSRPSISRPSTPSISRPSGSFKPTTPSRPTLPSRPGSGDRPTTLPSTRPGTGDRPTTLPGTRPGTGDRPTTLPGTRPGTGNRPTTLPGNINRPSLPSLGGNRPGAGDRIPNRPGDKPNIGDRFPNRPGEKPGIGDRFPNRPGGDRPSAGDLGDFLGIGGSLRPGPGTLPEFNRPGNDRPNIGSGNRGDLNLGSGNRGGSNIGSGNRGDRTNVNIGNINVGGNRVINNRPTWANIDRSRINTINNRWQNQIGRLGNYPARHPGRIGYWRGWGNGIRTGYWYGRTSRNWFNAGWWNRHPHRWCGWHYGYGFNRHPWSYWWTVPTYATVTNWFTWSAPQTVWQEPIYYDYGSEGNVVYKNNVVYIDGQQVASADEFAESAAALATVPPPETEEQAEQTEWLPLGTFAISTDQKDVDPNRVVQLAVSKEGIVSGTLYNEQTDEAVSVQGQVDKETQRVALRFGESTEVVAETGLYNLTQNDVPVLIHFGADRVENWLLVRLEEPESEPDDAS